MSGKTISWRVIAGMAITAVGTLVLLAFADTRDTLKGKADKTVVESMEVRIKNIEARSRSMDDKLDTIIWMHIDDKGNVKKWR